MAGQVEDLRLTRRETGALVAIWQVTDDCEQLTVSWGTSPVSIEHQRALTVDSHAGSVELRDGVRGRTYVSAATAGGGGSVVAGERRVPFAGPANFRDLGGYRTQTGRRTRWGRVFRSDALRLKYNDPDEFLRLGIRVVWDLRSDDERFTYPNRLPDPAPRSESVSLLVQDGDGPLHVESADDPDEFLVQVYIGILERSAGLLGQIFNGLAEDDGLPAVVHCAGGKDRTGMVAALLLTLLGVQREDVLDDYELTSQFRSVRRAAAMINSLRVDRRFRPAVAAGLIGTPRWAMGHALDVLEERLGGTELYLKGPAGVSDAAIGALRRQLLE